MDNVYTSEIFYFKNAKDYFFVIINSKTVQEET